MSPYVLRGAALGVGLAAALAFAAPAMASYSASIDGTTLRLAGDGASDKVVLVADSTNLVVDVGQDGTIDFTFPRTSFNAVSVTAGGGDDEFEAHRYAPSEAIIRHGAVAIPIVIWEQWRERFNLPAADTFPRDH